jgi:hypothetical protein
MDCSKNTLLSALGQVLNTAVSPIGRNSGVLGGDPDQFFGFSGLRPPQCMNRHVQNSVSSYVGG